MLPERWEKVMASERWEKVMAITLNKTLCTVLS